MNTVLDCVRGVAINGLFLEATPGQAYGLTAKNCVIEGTTRAVRAVTTDNVTITDCVLTGPNGVLTEGGSNMVIGPGNKITATTNDAINVQNNSANVPLDNDGISIVGNTLVGKRNGIQIYSNANGLARRVSLSNNRIAATDGAAVNLIGARGVAIGINTVSKSGGAFPVQESGSSNGVTVSGNTFPYPGPATNGTAPQFEVANNAFVN